jgi:outer membrane receptor protein involved in Fe transport
MLRKLLLILGMILTANLLVFSQSGTLKGKIIDKDSGEPIPFANVVIELGGSQQGGATSDFDGNYTIKPIAPGQYNVRASYVGYQPVQINDVIISADKITFLDLEMTSKVQNLEEVVITDYKVPLISKDQTSSGGTVTSEEIEKMPNKNADAIATTVGGVFSEDGEVKSIRGQRTEGTVYYIDGIKVTGAKNLPESAIDQVSVVLGGVPAQYGDATGGIINITTKGPSRKFGGGFSLQTSQFLDDFGYNRVGINLNGPLLRKKGDESSSAILGYYLAGEMIYKEDGFPNSTGVDRVDAETLQHLQENPISYSLSANNNISIINNSSYVRADNIDHLNATLNTERTTFNVSGKLDIKTFPTVNLTVGGNMSYEDRMNFDYVSSLFNWDMNTQSISNTRRAFVRFTNRFKNNDNESGLIKNTYLSFQADFSRYSRTDQNPDFKDDLLKYGYVGKFTTFKERNYTDAIIYDSTANLSGHLMDNWSDVLVTFEPGVYNPVLANYTNTVYSFFSNPIGTYDNLNNIMAWGGLLNSMQPADVYGLWDNVGASQDAYEYVQVKNDQVGLDLKVSTDIGNHEVKFGVSYEQKTDRVYAYQASKLWELMRGLTNSHIAQLDLNNPQPIYRDGYYMDTINYPRLYDGASQRTFDKNLRQAMGLPVNGTEWIDVDSYDLHDHTISYYDDEGIKHTASLSRPIDIEMFSADELLSSGENIAYYYGFDYKGNQLDSQPSFDDFFNETDENGDFKRNLQAFRPIYMAGYIQDKFAFKDLIFNIGLRVDRFDANQMVMKDPYLLFPTYTAGEVRANQNLSLDEIPGNIGDDYVVYVDNADNPSAITGFRNQDVWYDASGAETINPEDALDAGGGIQPYLMDPDNKTVNSKVFEDYEPQINVMPRVAFSFPISDEALFFAHYDVLTQRPKSNLRMDPSIYYFLPTSSLGTTSINNPNLKPEQTIDYELGFQQRLSNTSSLILSAFYREIRDQIQSYRFTGAYPSTYYSYNNLDFGTVKGLTVTYDLRRTKNIRLKASYTLQFADGTGSDAQTAKSLIQSGQPNLRTLIPLSFDRRHAINMMLDYRFGEGKNYNGPTSTRKIKGSDKVKTIQWLKNTGVNLTLNGGSGTPYTKSSRIVPLGGQRIIEGSINGARKPAQFRFDLRLDRDIDIAFGKGGKHDAMMNVYLQVLNLFDTQNVLNVYDATGNPDDDGFLAAEEWQTTINSKVDSQAYRDMYALRILSPYNYSAPRQIRLGLEFNF